jgi:hypothetical protein
MPTCGNVPFKLTYLDIARGLMIKSNEKKSLPASPIVIGIAAWLIPGSGHIISGHKARGWIMFGAICITYFLGLLLGSIEQVDPKHNFVWFLPQILAGGPTLLTMLLSPVDVASTTVMGKGFDYGLLYTSVAGFLNLLCIMDAIMRDQEVHESQVPREDQLSTEAKNV